MPVERCEWQLTNIIEQLSRDPWPVANDKRALRCTGNAISVAVGLLEVRIRQDYNDIVTGPLCARRQRSLILVQGSWFSLEDPAQKDLDSLWATSFVNLFDHIMISKEIVSNTSSGQRRSFFYLII